MPNLIQLHSITDGKNDQTIELEQLYISVYIINNWKNKNSLLKLSTIYNRLKKPDNILITTGKICKPDNILICNKYLFCSAGEVHNEQENSNHKCVNIMDSHPKNWEHYHTKSCQHSSPSLV